jgi:hypothetical protein
MVSISPELFPYQLSTWLGTITLCFPRIPGGKFSMELFVLNQ